MNRLRVSIAGGFLALCLLLGGASAGGALANGLLQFLAVIILLLHVWSSGAPAMPREGRWLATIFLLFAAIALLQLVPLPPSIWTALPGREVTVDSLKLLGLDPVAAPASLDPRRTVASLLWLLPPAAMFLVTTRLTRDERGVPAKVLLVIAGASVVLGALQLFGGDVSPLRPYQITNPNRSVGFFANANHVATLMLFALPLCALFVGRASKSRSGGGREGRGFIYAVLAVFIAIGVAMNGSLAAYGMLVPTAVGSVLLYLRTAGKKIGRGGWAAGATLLALVAGLSLYGPLSSERLAAKFDDSAGSVGRKISVPLTLEAAADHFPVGSGLGTFRDVYRTYERVEDATFVFVNHAHNDYAEVALELGVPGLVAVLLFILWWAARSWASWRGEFNGVALARAGSIMIGVVLAHSLVDYPIRTSAIAAAVALAAGFMVPPPAAQRRRDRSGGKRQARHMDADSI